ncbi:hypothetical protein [Niabella aquatica]
MPGTSSQLIKIPISSQGPNNMLIFLTQSLAGLNFVEVYDQINILRGCIKVPTQFVLSDNNRDNLDTIVVSVSAGIKLFKDKSSFILAVDRIKKTYFDEVGRFIVLLDIACGDPSIYRHHPQQVVFPGDPNVQMGSFQSSFNFEISAYILCRENNAS